MGNCMESGGGGGVWVYAVPLIAYQGRSCILENLVFRDLTLWPVYVVVFLVGVCAALICWAAPGGPAWGSLNGTRTIPGPRGWPILGSLLDMDGHAHRRLAALARKHNALSLMAFSLGTTRVVITSEPVTARDILCSSGFANRPLKESVQQLLFERAIGFAPYGEHWRKARRIASSHLFAAKRIAAHEHIRQGETSAMLDAIALDCRRNGGSIHIRRFLQHAALNNIMLSTFGRRYDFRSTCEEARELQSMVREGFELLGAFNIADHLPVLQTIDPMRVHQRCAALVPRVSAFIQRIIDAHRLSIRNDDDSSDFVDILLKLQCDDKLDDADIVAILWEMIFRGTDTMAILAEWIVAELVLNPDIQAKVHAEIDSVLSQGLKLTDTEIENMSYLQAVIKETLRIHPPGPLLSWARLATHDLYLAGHHIPAGTTAMVNMWAISHDPTIWDDPEKFKPDRFLKSQGGVDIDIRGSDLRLAPFGAGRRVCPGRALGLATVSLWLAHLVERFEWIADPLQPVDLSEVLKLSSEMATPLCVYPVSRKSQLRYIFHVEQHEQAQLHG